MRKMQGEHTQGNAHPLTLTMSESQGKKEPKSLPSGQPPSQSNLEDETDREETRTPPLVAMVSQEEYLAREANKDPPATGGLTDGYMGEDEAETDATDEVSEEAGGQNHRQTDLLIPDAVDMPTAQPSSVLPRGNDNAGCEPIDVTHVKNRTQSPEQTPSHIFSSQTEQPSELKQSLNSSKEQAELAMAPNNNPSPGHDVKQEFQEILRQEGTKQTSEDEKKSEDKNDKVIVPVPHPAYRNAVFSMPALHETSGSPQPAIHAAIRHQLPMYGYAPAPYAASPIIGGGRRKIKLRLEEDVRIDDRRSFFSRSFSRHRRDDSLLSVDSVAQNGIDRGSISVSWFEGTTSAELQEHVRKSVVRKMGLHGDVKLSEMRLIDESMDPPEEIVLSPFIPNGSRFLLRFSIKEREHDTTSSFGPRRYLNKDYLNNQIASTAPESPSKAPSPYPSSGNLLNLNEAQLQILSAKLKELQLGKSSFTNQTPAGREVSVPSKEKGAVESAVDTESLEGESDGGPRKVSKMGDDGSKSSDFNDEEVMSMHPDDQIEARLRQLTDLLVSDRRVRRDRGGSSGSRQEKTQVIFVLANYFVLFLSCIAIMAEIQSRAPRWLEWAERNLESVQTCAMDQESLFKCVSSGDFSGLIASFVLWFGRSAATRRFFLFGFETPKRLWTVVYESLVTAFCWGVSYIFIRRGMNPDTRSNFIAKYWKDAVYGSLAGFNASFLKAVLKNLVPQEAVEYALQDNQLRILSWLPKWH